MDNKIRFRWLPPGSRLYVTDSTGGTALELLATSILYSYTTELAADTYTVRLVVPKSNDTLNYYPFQPSLWELREMKVVAYRYYLSNGTVADSIGYYEPHYLLVVLRDPDFPELYALAITEQTCVKVAGGEYVYWLSLTQRGGSWSGDWNVTV